VPTQVGDDDAVPGGECVEDRLEHFAGDHQPVDEQERRTLSTLEAVGQTRLQLSRWLCSFAQVSFECDRTIEERQACLNFAPTHGTSRSSD
jgi:hypothetical protein